ncbi:D-sedoheptulose-7-phosphate isomerase [Undibacterium pigrum]|uniref:D-sedoheptulose 7-phosphate isomerase n=1 Tax=Undibacterium pigrum TaxID=401470 RepID=A0A318JEL7_9BURK|nr:SIS domain-containing protein [Undibacterium pigrum]PXX47006.1 D-sedoheptulose 7-phosphate isomerase [Undibacterium pigrum]
MNDTENTSHLQALYPFLTKKKSDAVSINQALLDSIEQKMAQHHKIVDQFFSTHQQAVVDCANAIADSYRKHGQLFTMGNGGSSSDASHVAVEFLHPVTTGRPALPAYDLSCDKTVMTAIANDVGYQHVYSRQVANLMKKNDVLFGISTSGNSDNLLRAFAQAKKIGATTIGLAGGNGGEMARTDLDHCLVVDSDSIHRTQECHVAIYHVLWDLVHTLLADERGYLSSKTQQYEERTEAEHEIR